MLYLYQPVNILISSVFDLQNKLTMYFSENISVDGIMDVFLKKAFIDHLFSDLFSSTHR